MGDGDGESVGCETVVCEGIIKYLVSQAGGAGSWISCCPVVCCDWWQMAWYDDG